MSDRVAINVSSHVAHMTLTRADKMNALDPAMFEAICGAIDRTERDARSPRRGGLWGGPRLLRGA